MFADEFSASKRRPTISRPVQTRVNERIRIREVRLIDEEGNQIVVVTSALGGVTDGKENSARPRQFNEFFCEQRLRLIVI